MKFAKRKKSYTFDTQLKYLRADTTYPGGLTEEQYGNNPFQSGNWQNFKNRIAQGMLQWRYKLAKKNIFSIKSQVRQERLDCHSKVYPTTYQRYSLFSLAPSLENQITLFGKKAISTVGVYYSQQKFSNSAIIKDSTRKKVSFTKSLKVDFLPNVRFFADAGLNFLETKGDFNTGLQGNEGKHLWSVSSSIDYRWSDFFSTAFYYQHHYQMPFIDQSNLMSGGYQANFRLKPQFTDKYMLMMKYSSKKISTSIRVYYAHIINTISYDSDSRSNSNFATIAQPGVSASFDVFASSFWSFGTSWDFKNPQFLEGDYTGKILPNSALAIGEVHSHFTFTKEAGFYLQSQYIGKKYTDSDFKNESSSYGDTWLAHASLSYLAGPLSLVLRVNNLFDKKYCDYITYYSKNNKAFYPALGVDTKLSLTYKF